MSNKWPWAMTETAERSRDENGKEYESIVIERRIGDMRSRMVIDQVEIQSAVHPEGVMKFKKLDFDLNFIRTFGIDRICYELWVFAGNKHPEVKRLQTNAAISFALGTKDSEEKFKALSLWGHIKYWWRNQK